MPTSTVTIDLGPAGRHAVEPGVWSLVVQRARAKGLDPRAVLAVWLGEGGIRFSGNDGDYTAPGNPSSFGPPQLHEGGALPAQYNGNDAAARAFANSPAGIDYALDQIAKVAKGLTGPAAVDAIVRRFERPRDPDASSANARARYERLGAVTLPATLTDTPAATPLDGTTPVALFPFPGGSLPSNPEAPGVVGGAVADAIGGPLLTGVAYAGLTLAGLTLIVVGLLRALGTSPLELARNRAARTAYDRQLDDEIPF